MLTKTHYNLSHQRCKDVPPRIFRMTHLRVLDLSFNCITFFSTVDFCSLRYLEYLDLSSNRISEFSLILSLSQLSRLASLTILPNPFSPYKLPIVNNQRPKKSCISIFDRTTLLALLLFKDFTGKTRFNSLAILDGVPISKDERSKAFLFLNKLYGKNLNFNANPNPNPKSKSLSEPIDSNSTNDVLDSVLNQQITPFVPIKSNQSIKSTSESPPDTSPPPDSLSFDELLDLDLDTWRKLLTIEQGSADGTSQVSGLDTIDFPYIAWLTDDTSAVNQSQDGNVIMDVIRKTFTQQKELLLQELNKVNTLNPITSNDIDYLINKMMLSINYEGLSKPEESTIAFNFGSRVVESRLRSDLTLKQKKLNHEVYKCHQDRVSKELQRPIKFQEHQRPRSNVFDFRQRRDQIRKISRCQRAALLKEESSISSASSKLFNDHYAQLFAMVKVHSWLNDFLKRKKDFPFSFKSNMKQARDGSYFRFRNCTKSTLESNSKKNNEQFNFNSLDEDISMVDEELTLDSIRNNVRRNCLLF
ncbi:hypothetical protein P9112_003383 [Eukaryota sp. TZLM1-RC]